MLGVPGGEEQIGLEIAERKAAEAVPLYLEKGLDATMNLINIDPEAQKKAEEKRRLKQERREQEKKRKAEEFVQQKATSGPEHDTVENLATSD
ncbi:hypothetical protein [Dictyobacter kobayashii]|uniref:Uncharacterized protein n=1 Tax=Dictyobacter kobayashii TaxID=2014872 RepID=A0A402ADR7_9CHLR|nr:hypothetical protein [Dictyobacter kobayashii]GCE17259.1 hypothetical protein KDK_10590 [Dictyobacter kobayashii]